MSHHNRYSEIEPGLWIGACPGSESPAFAQAILNLFGLTPYTVRCDAYREERLLDLDVPDEELLHSLAAWVHNQRERGRIVLVHCQEGRNRSALVVGLYLVRFRGMRGDEAIELIRQKRGASALYNGAFVRYLQGLKPDRALSRSAEGEVPQPGDVMTEGDDGYEPDVNEIRIVWDAEYAGGFGCARIYIDGERVGGKSQTMGLAVSTLRYLLSPDGTIRERRSQVELLRAATARDREAREADH